MRPITLFQQPGFSPKKTSTSPTRPIHYLKASIKKDNRRSSSPPSQSQGREELNFSLSSAYKEALNQNQRLREQLYFLLMDYPDHMSTRSLGISQSERDTTIAKAEVQLTLIEEYQLISAKFRESLKTICEIRTINKNIQNIFQNDLKCQEQ